MADRGEADIIPVIVATRAYRWDACFLNLNWGSTVGTLERDSVHRPPVDRSGRSIGRVQARLLLSGRPLAMADRLRGKDDPRSALPPLWVEEPIALRDLAAAWCGGRPPGEARVAAALLAQARAALNVPSTAGSVVERRWQIEAGDQLVADPVALLTARALLSAEPGEAAEVIARGVARLHGGAIERFQQVGRLWGRRARPIVILAADQAAADMASTLQAAVQAIEMTPEADLTLIVSPTGWERLKAALDAHSVAVLESGPSTAEESHLEPREGDDRAAPEPGGPAGSKTAPAAANETEAQRAGSRRPRSVEAGAAGGAGGPLDALRARATSAVKAARRVQRRRVRPAEAAPNSRPPAASPRPCCMPPWRPTREPSAFFSSMPTAASRSARGLRKSTCSADRLGSRLRWMGIFIFRRRPPTGATGERTG